MAFLGRNTPTPLLSAFMAQVDDTIVEVVCSHGTGGVHVDWSPHLRKFANMKIQVPLFRGGFGITPNEGRRIISSCGLTVVPAWRWLGNSSTTSSRTNDSPSKKRVMSRTRHINTWPLVLKSIQVRLKVTTNMGGGHPQRSAPRFVWSVRTSMTSTCSSAGHQCFSRISLKV